MLVVLLVLSFFIVQPFLKVIFLGALFAYVSYPLYRKFNRKINSTVSALLICLLIFLIIVIPAVFFVKGLVQESYNVFIIFKQKLATGLISNCKSQLCETLRSYSQNSEINFQVQETAKTVINWIVNKSSDLLVSVPKVLLNLFVLFFTLFYFLKDGKDLLRKINHYLKLQRNNYIRLLRRLKEIVHGLVYGYLVVALIQGLTGYLGFLIFGISSPLFWGLFMAFLALIPFVGAGIIWVPASIIIILEGVYNNSTWLIVKGVLLFIYGLVFISSVDNIFKPKLMGNKAKIHSVVVLIGILGGLFTFGLLGVILGPLLLSFTIEFIDIYLLKK
ncbi:AI-2E family transporter [Candidatus Woesearchaeota archaeon]|jgi:predicted PurR-regulated permease PerM|nr:AI-2E family transporter [Candidatus Woesearchaeota archaeon]MBT5342789.1 AI-2E family transporter [Candidatus Woesearchaeota archaeon]